LIKENQGIGEIQEFLSCSSFCVEPALFDSGKRLPEKHAMKAEEKTREQVMGHSPNLRRRLSDREEKKAEGTQVNAILDAMSDHV